MLKIRKVSDYELKLIRKKGDGAVNGLFEMDDPTYRKQKGLSYSAFKEFLTSPAAYKNYLTAPKKFSPAMQFGTAAHCKILEPERFDVRYTQAPNLDGPKTRNPWKQEWEDFKAANVAKTVLSRDSWYALDKMQQVIFETEASAQYFRNGTPEVAMFWTDPVTGIQCKAKCDWLSEEHGVIDYKTTSVHFPSGNQEVVGDALIGEIAKYRYHMQVAHYMAGVSALHLDCEHNFTFVFQRTHSGFECVPLDLHPQDVERAFALRARKLKEFKECQETNHWPGLPYLKVRGRLPDSAFA